jgi:hypothetical protein
MSRIWYTTVNYGIAQSIYTKCDSHTVVNMANCDEADVLPQTIIYHDFFGVQQSPAAALALSKISDPAPAVHADFNSGAISPKS